MFANLFWICLNVLWQSNTYHPGNCSTVNMCIIFFWLFFMFTYYLTSFFSAQLIQVSEFTPIRFLPLTAAKGNVRQTSRSHCFQPSTGYWIVFLLLFPFLKSEAHQNEETSSARPMCECQSYTVPCAPLHWAVRTASLGCAYHCQRVQKQAFRPEHPFPPHSALLPFTRSHFAP